MRLWGAIIFVFAVADVFAKARMQPEQMVVSVPVANVRAEPVPEKNDYQYDKLQETQLEEGELVLVHEEKNGWARVSCPLQMEFTHNELWEGYPGWVEMEALTDDLSKQKIVEPLQGSPDELRSKLLLEASRHLGNPYLWGGRSLHDPSNKQTATGVDCSGLVHWSFRQIGWNIPRDAHEQYMKAEKRDPENLKPADLLFLANVVKPEKIVHVAFYAGDDFLLEAPQSGERVRKISFKDRFGKSLHEMKSGDVVGERIIYFGTLMAEEK